MSSHLDTKGTIPHPLNVTSEQPIAKTAQPVQPDTPLTQPVSTCIRSVHSAVNEDEQTVLCLRSCQYVLSSLKTLSDFSIYFGALSDDLSLIHSARPLAVCCAQSQYVAIYIPT